MGSLELQRYIESVWNEPLVIGKHDCLTFCNSAFKAYHGYGWADDWLDRYMIDDRPMRKNEMRKEFGFSNIVDAVSTKLKPIKTFPKEGSVVVTNQARRWITGYAFGISNGERAIFLDKVGVIFLPMASVNYAWTANDKI